ncbi:hypothetical protein [Stenotrophomonas sp. Iso1]|uniref:hypothetical protein n=1 Tax=Stenotrophomonas sp. Iso1 TaxID=2977283 RepID=UPI0022B774DF|nr:hypothetical protein [Stenotrophomonas sp. Iso1]
MDDIVVTGVDTRGHAATLELQAKRTITFAANDAIFGEVVALACQAAAAPGFFDGRHELAVVTARTTTKIEMHVQTVLRWARDNQTAAPFFARLNQTGVGHQAMRDFVSAFRGKMQAAGADHDDEAVWRLLSRFQVLVFDLEHPGSICMALARDRCAAALASTDSARAGELWDSLARIALEIDASGGDLDALSLRARVVERGYRLVGDRRLFHARERLAAIAHHALDDIKTTVRGVHVDRSSTVDEALLALGNGRYLEIRGEGGVGKSAVLKDIAIRVLMESRVLVLAPNRVPAGGWEAFRSQLGCDASASQLLSDLAGDGGGMLLIDGIDRFDEPGQRNTIADLLRAAASVAGFRVVATTRSDFDTDDRSWLPMDAIQQLGEVATVLLGDLTEEHVAHLRQADATLSELLRPGQPAEALVRNLYRLDRLSRAAGSDTTALTEAQMAKQWWDTGDRGERSNRIYRQRVLYALAEHLLVSSEPMDLGTLSASAIEDLVESGSLRLLSAARGLPKHDVLGDWAIGCLLHSEPSRVASLPLSRAAPARLVRGLEMAARLHAEQGTNSLGWRDLLAQASASGSHGSWRRAVLLAPVRSERSTEALDNCLPDLAGEDDARLLSDIIRATVVLDSRPAAPIWAAVGIDTTNFTDDFVLPRGPGWLNLIQWSLVSLQRLPESTIPEWIDLYGRWCAAYLGKDAISPRLVRHLYDWLVVVEATRSDFRRGSAHDPGESPRLWLPRARREDLRRTFLAWCQLCPAETASYLSQLGMDPRRDEAFEGLLAFIGSAANAAPEALADLFILALPEGDDDDRHHSELFPRWDLNYLPASPARPPFLALLQAEKHHGLRLIRSVVDYVVTRRTRGRAAGQDQVAIDDGDSLRSYPWQRSYMMSRSDNSYIVQSALMALEAWGHQRIEAGDDFADVLNDILGPESSPAAYLLVAVDLLLSHWPKSLSFIGPFASSPELLTLDHIRPVHEAFNQHHQPWIHPEPTGSVRLNDLMQRASRRVSLERVLGLTAINGPEPIRASMERALQDAIARLGPPDENADLNDPKVMATHALNLLNPANYRGVGEPPGAEGYEYVSPAEEEAHFARLQQQSASRTSQTSLCLQLTQEIMEPSCPSALLDQGLAWATRPTPADESPEDETDREIIERARLVVAALVLRDSATELQAAHRAWATEQLTAAADSEINEYRHQRLPYNTHAIAAIGLLADSRNVPSASDFPRLFRLATQLPTGIVEVMRLELKAHRHIADAIGRSLVRLAFSGSIYAVRQPEDWVGGASNYQALEAARAVADRERRQAAVEAELAWHAGDASEPSWPELPAPHDPRPRRGLRIGHASMELEVPVAPRVLALAESSAATVLSVAVDLWRVSHPALLESLVRHAWPWTAAANGVGADPEFEPGERAFEWNHAYFPAALAAAALDPGTLQSHMTGLLAQLPEQRFLIAAGITLQALDQLWLGDRVIDDDVALPLRESIAGKIFATWSWRRLCGELTTGIDSDAVDAVAAIYMCNYVLGEVSCYITPIGMPQVDRCLPFLEDAAVQAAGSTFVALTIMRLLDVDPQPHRLGVLSRLVRAWWAARGADADFWINYGIAQRVRDWIAKSVLAVGTDASVLESDELASILDVLLQCAGPMALALEERVTAARNRLASSAD